MRTGQREREGGQKHGRAAGKRWPPLLSAWHASRMLPPHMPGPAPAPGRYNTETVSPEVLAQMKAAMQESSNSAASHSFLLDDDSAIPFNQADVERMVDDTVGVGGAGPGKEGGRGSSRPWLRLPPRLTAVSTPPPAAPAGPAGRDAGAQAAQGRAILCLPQQAARGGAAGVRLRGRGNQGDCPPPSRGHFDRHLLLYWCSSPAVASYLSELETCLAPCNAGSSPLWLHASLHVHGRRC